MKRGEELFLLGLIGGGMFGTFGNIIATWIWECFPDKRYIIIIISLIAIFISVIVYSYLLCMRFKEKR